MINIIYNLSKYIKLQNRNMFKLKIFINVHQRKHIYFIFIITYFFYNNLKRDGKELQTSN